MLMAAASHPVFFCLRSCVRSCVPASPACPRHLRARRQPHRQLDIQCMPGSEPYIIHIIAIFTGARIDGIPGSVIIRISKGHERIVKRIQTIIDHRK